MSRFLITGGAGFIGSHLVEHVLQQGHSVRVIDNLATGRRENLAPFLSDIDYHEADLRDADSVQQAIKGVEVVLHQAALPSVPRSIKNPIESHEVNVTGTLNLLIAARDAGVKRLVYAASSSAYGNLDVPVKHEDLSTTPISPYGCAKLSAEQYCRVFYETYGLETVSLRYFNVFGPRQNPYSAYTGVMAIFIPRMLNGEAPIIFGDGSATRDFTYIRNNVEANMLAVSASEAPGEVINIACGTSASILDIVEGINRALGTSIQPEFQDPRPGDIRHSLASVEKAKRILGYEPLVSLEEGIAHTVEWYREEMKSSGGGLPATT